MTPLGSAVCDDPAHPRCGDTVKRFEFRSLRGFNVFDSTAVENAQKFKIYKCRRRRDVALAEYSARNEWSLQMSKIPPSKFAPELIAIMRSALDSAADHIDEATPATKAKMAQRIVRVAAQGVTDARQLVAAAIDEAKQPAD
jgi:hypothetical protein